MAARAASRAARRASAARRKSAGRSGESAARIVAAARRHFFAHGFRHVTMDDLAAELVASKKTLYASFPSKEALLEAVLKDKFQSVEADLERLAADTGGDALDNLKRVLACLQHHTADTHPPFVRDVRRAAPEMFRVIEPRGGDLIRR